MPLNFDELSERQLNIVGNLTAAGWNQDQIAYELPAVERIVDDLEGVKPSRFSARNKPPQGSYLANSTESPGMANALINNLSQRVMGALNPAARAITKQRPIDVARMIAVGAKSIEENRSIWEGMGLMNKVYGGSDVVENRYAMAAEMLSNYLQTHPMPDWDMPMGKASDKPPCGLCPNPTMDFSAFIDEFKDWMDSMEYHMQLVSKEIDRTIGSPASRIKHLKIYDEEGDKTDITDLDWSNFNRITPDSLAILASDKTVAALTIDTYTMTEQYIEETRKYIDVFVVDQSSSMSDYGCIIKACAFLLNRLDKVIDGYAMCAVIDFDTKARIYELPRNIAGDKPLWMIDTPEKAKWAKLNIVKQYASFVGGGTSIPAGVNKGIELSKEMEKHGGILPNITVVTDDDNSIAQLDASLITIPVNGLALKGNTDLQDFCISTGGGYNNMQLIGEALDSLKKGN